jgi:hypothetical protein
MRPDAPGWLSHLMPPPRGRAAQHGASAPSGSPI